MGFLSCKKNLFPREAQASQTLGGELPLHELDFMGKGNSAPVGRSYVMGKGAGN